jgi:hypothetical protein
MYRLVQPRLPLRRDRPLAVDLAQMSPAQRRHAYRSGLFDARRRALWASLYPEEPPLVNGEFEWIALDLADLD